jgi:hypothetical protein
MNSGSIYTNVIVKFQWYSSEMLKKANADATFADWVVYLFDVGITCALAADIFRMCEETKLAKIGGKYCLSNIIKAKDDSAILYFSNFTVSVTNFRLSYDCRLASTRFWSLLLPDPTAS